jgi:hypothetical protein
MSAGVTVHHCQGSTFDRIGLDLERRGRSGSKPVIQPGLGYTALARPRTLLGLSCQDLEERHLKASTSVKAEMLRLRTKARLVFRCPQLDASPSPLVMYNHNVRSFRLYKDAIFQSPAFTAAHLTFLQETNCPVAANNHIRSWPQAKVIELIGHPNSPRGLAFIDYNGCCDMQEVERLPYSQETRIIMLAMMVTRDRLTILLIRVYRFPASDLSLFTEDLTDLCCRNPHPNTIVLGDFNFNVDATQTLTLAWRMLSAVMGMLDLHHFRRLPPVRVA